MGLLEQIYSFFGLFYSIALIFLKHKDFSGTDIAFTVGTAVFVGLNIGSYINEIRLIPSEYRWRFTGKSLLRELLGPLLSLFYYPILFRCDDRVKRALTFSNEAYDGVEWTRQLHKFELVGIKRGAHYNIKDHCLSRIGKGPKERWGYERLVGDIWVTVTFEDLDERYGAAQGWELRTSVHGETSLEEVRPVARTNLQGNDSKQGRETVPADPGSSSRAPLLAGKKTPADLESSGTNLLGNDSKQGRENVPADPGSSSRTPLLAGKKTPADLETSSTSGTSGKTGTDEAQYNVTINWRREICSMENGECWLCPSFTRNLECTKYPKWTLFQMHQYMHCVDAWGNHPKQGIWKLSDQLFKYCYRHDELINAIEGGMRLRQTGNDGRRFIVV